jgi:malate dehydrogenase (oxaloacetate-decarboxylating)(NADP+)
MCNGLIHHVRNEKPDSRQNYLICTIAEPSIRALYPFCRLTGDANVLVMPGLHSALITTRLVHRLGGGTTIGPLVIGMEQPVQVLPMDASVSQMVDVACLAAYQAIAR